MLKKQYPSEAITPFGIEKEYANFNNSKYHIICVPYAETVTYIKGAENAPLAILKASTQVELYDIESKKEPYIDGISMSEIKVNIDIQHIWNNTGKEVLTCIKNKKFPILLGGEHTITYGALRAASILIPDISVLQIDAHTDLRSEYMDSPFNHACALRHAFNSNIPITQVGIRSVCKEEAELIEQNPDLVTTFFTNKAGLDIDKVLNSFKHKNVYISIDLDGFDPSVIPHVGTPEPGGLGWFEVIELLKEVFKKFNVIAADIVELAPNKYSYLSDFAAAKLLYKLISLKP